MEHGHHHRPVVICERSQRGSPPRLLVQPSSSDHEQNSERRQRAQPTEGHGHGKTRDLDGRGTIHGANELSARRSPPLQFANKTSK